MGGDGVVYMVAWELWGYITTAFRLVLWAIMRHGKALYAVVAYGKGLKFKIHIQFPIPKLLLNLPMTWHENVPRSSRYVRYPHSDHPIPSHPSIYMSRQTKQKIKIKEGVCKRACKMFIARQPRRQTQYQVAPSSRPVPNTLAQIYNLHQFSTLIRRQPPSLRFPFRFPTLLLRHPPRTLPRLPIHPPPLTLHNHKRPFPRTPIQQRRHTPLRVDEVVQRTPVVDRAPLAIARDGGVAGAARGEGGRVDVVGVHLRAVGGPDGWGWGVCGCSRGRDGIDD